MNAHLWAKAFLAATILAGSGHAATIYVCKTSDPDCTWSIHFEELQDALADASSGTVTEIWVAKGVYYPDDGTGVTADDRTETFTLKNKVDIYGGFTGNESTLSARDFGCGGDETLLCSTNDDCTPPTICKNATILSGEIQQNGITMDNSYHIVTYSTPNAVVTLDGFTVQAGRADAGSAPNNQGGAVHIKDGNPCIAGGPTLTNCIFRDNYPSDHGAVNDHGCSTTVDNCAFLDNDAGTQGAALNVDNGSPTISNSFFDDNGSGGVRGGGAWLGSRTEGGGCACSKTPTFTDCDFTSNSGKAIWVEDSDPTFTRCTFTGGGVHLEDSDNFFTDCAFDANGAGRGGAVFSVDSDSSFTDCDFTNNFSTDGGGAIWVEGDTLTLTGCWFGKNKDLGSESYGGGVHAASGATTNVTNCHFIQNDAKGGGALYYSGSTAVVSDTLFYLNRAVSGGLFPVGGAVLIDNSNKDTSFVNCIFSRNMATVSFPNKQGGAFYINHKASTTPWTTTIVNCLFNENQSSGDGGAIYHVQGDLTITNSTFDGNRTTGSGETGGGVYVVNISTAEDVTITNSIFWDNEDSNGMDEGSQITAADSGDVTVTYTCVESCTVYCPMGTTNTGSNPNFAAGDTGTWESVLYIIAADITEFTDTGASWTDDELVGFLIDPDAPGSDEVVIIFNTATTVTVRADFSGGFSSGQSYEITELRLSSSSTALLDQGDNNALALSSPDLNGKCRIIDADSDCDAKIDMGAFEYGTAAECCDDTDCSGGDSCNGNVCSECCDDNDCTGGEVCCNDTCVVGDCCASVDCGSEVCCANTCCNANAVCCNDICCNTGEVCCDGTCTAVECCSDGDCGGPKVCCANICCAVGEVCCNGTCTAAECCNDSDCSFPTRNCCDNVCKACCDGSDCFSGCCNGGVCVQGPC